MPLSTFYELVKSALPEDVRPDELLSCAPRGIWENNPYEATVIALRDCPRLNWDAYLLRNPDVKASGMEPHWHYIKHGIYEGRKLVSWHAIKKPEKPGMPLVTLIIINYNNAHFLGKCLDSVVNQSLQDMEIIIVDDCSTDESMEIIGEYAKRDKRIKALVNERNSATLIARKRGVLAATGRYIMFLDSDDYLENNACETAASAIASGYDVVKFGVNLTNIASMPEMEAANCSSWCNMGENREYVYDEVLSSFFVEFKLSWLVWSCIYLRELVVAAFNDLPDAYFTGADDALAVLAISHRVRSMLKIPDKLIHYNYGLGVSVSGEPRTFLKYLPARCDTAKYFSEYIRKHALSVDGERLYSIFCEPIIDKFIYVFRERESASRLEILTEVIEKKYVMRYLINHYAYNLRKISVFLKPLDIVSAKIRHLGVYCPEPRQLGVMTILRNLCELCTPDQYQITIFTEQKLSKDDGRLPAWVHVIQLSQPYRGSGDLIEHTECFAETVTGNGVDALLYLGTWRPHLVWNTLFMHWLRIPMIFMRHCNDTSASYDSLEMKLLVQDVLFQGADAVICASQAEELYLRRCGVSAIWIPAPSYPSQSMYRREIPPRIAAICRQNTGKHQMHQILLVLREVVKHTPWVSLVLMCDWSDAEKRQEWTQQIRDFCLERHVRFRAWEEDIRHILKSCGVFLSVDHGGAVDFGLTEAQALGIPCVIYEPILTQCENGQSVIQAHQGDYKAAAREIIAMFTEPDRWRILSACAVDDSKKHTAEIFVKIMRNFLDNFHVSMPLRKYEERDYLALMKVASFHGDIVKGKTC